MIGQPASQLADQNCPKGPENGPKLPEIGQKQGKIEVFFPR
jgi:hypothetical protein